MGSENIKNIYPVYENPLFWERLTFLKESQFWDTNKMKDFQTKKMKHLIYWASKNVPFYIDYFSKNKLSLNDFQTLNDIKKLPIVDKKILQSNYDLFLTKDVKKEELIHRTTGGSTGTPLIVYADNDYIARDKANTDYYMSVFDLDIFNFKSIRIYGDYIPEELIKEKKYWYESNKTKLVMSCYHIDEATLNLYCDKIADWNPHYIHTRPSSIYPIAKLMIENNKKFKIQLKYIFCDGEYITEKQREIIEKAFQVRVINIYGHTEGCAVGHPCSYSNNLHFMPQVGLIEVLDEEGNEVKSPNEKGEMIVTGFNNYIFPLIRYRTGDIAVMADQSCRCGRHYKILEKVEGRFQDYVISSNGTLIPLAPAVFNYNDYDWSGIKEFQVVQEKAGVLEFLIQPFHTQNHQKLALEVKQAMLKILSNDFEITVKLVEDIPKTKIGKHRYLKQMLNIKNKDHI